MQKIVNNEEINRLRRIGKIRKNSIGIIFRTASRDVERSILEEEYKVVNGLIFKNRRAKKFLANT